MAISKFFGNLKQKTQTFLGQARHHVNKSVRYLNDSFLPSAKAAHRVIQNVSSNLQQSPDLGEKAKSHLTKLSTLADAGIKHVGVGVDLANRVHSAF